MNRKRWFALHAFLSCFLIFSVSVFALEVGTTAPDFQLKTLDGQDVRLSDYQGRIVLLKLATTWCPTCKQATEEICDLSSFLSKNKVVVMEVFVQDSEAMIRDYIRNRDYGALEHVVLQDDSQKVMKAYDVYLIPRLIFLDGELRVRRDVSIIPGREMVKQIEKMLAEAAPGGAAKPE